MQHIQEVSISRTAQFFIVPDCYFGPTFESLLDYHYHAALWIFNFNKHLEYELSDIEPKVTLQYAWWSILDILKFRGSGLSLGLVQHFDLAPESVPHRRASFGQRALQNPANRAGPRANLCCGGPPRCLSCARREPDQQEVSVKGRCSKARARREAPGRRASPARIRRGWPGLAESPGRARGAQGGVGASPRRRGPSLRGRPDDSATSERKNYYKKSKIRRFSSPKVPQAEGIRG